MTISKRLTEAEKRSIPTEHITGTPEFDMAMTSFFLKVRECACSSCTPDLKVERLDFAGSDVSELCFSNCDVFFARETAEAKKLDREDPVEDAIYTSFIVGKSKRIECQGGRKWSGKMYWDE